MMDDKEKHLEAWYKSPIVELDIEVIETEVKKLINTGKRLDSKF